jgi:hypothetical protein
MPIPDVFYSRDVPLPDIFKYNEVPEKLRNQCYLIWNEFFAQELGVDLNDLFQFISKTVCGAIGVRELPSRFRDTAKEGVETLLHTSTDYKIVLTIIELVCHVMEFAEDEGKKYHFEIEYSAQSAIDDINYRFKENGIGYYYINKKIIRVDSNLLHEEIIKPALHLLTAPEFKNANTEYLLAHEHFRFNRNGEAINECLKAFETTMKIICSLKGWQYDPTHTSKNLIKILFDKGFIPAYMDNKATALRQLLESSVPTIRNKTSSHGRGTV